MKLIYIKNGIFICKTVYKFIASDFMANSISLFSLVVAIIAILIGGKKVSEVLLEYKRKRREAVFGYHINLKKYILRLKRLVSDNRCKPMESLYLFSSNEEIRKKGAGYESLGIQLSNLAQKFLDYLSTESNQIPACMKNCKIEEWDILIDKLVHFLVDFLLFETRSYLPEFDTEENVDKYHDKLVEVLDNILLLIEESKSDYKDELGDEND
ncbi:MAG: hypothetical protein J6K58_00825 [Lachnospiraceae bacterium]|nr:hypothetical protein [Lachnospiraceae bacterium]